MAGTLSCHTRVPIFTCCKLHTYTPFQNLYDNDLIKIAEHHLGANSTYYAITTGQILGAEVTLWSEKVFTPTIYVIDLLVVLFSR